MKRYLFMCILLTGCVKDIEVYQSPELRDTYIKSVDGYTTLLIVDNDTISTFNTVRVKFIKE